MNTTATRIRSALRWPGNKSRMLKLLLPEIPPHVCSCEVFGGSLAFTLAKERSELEVVNDFNGDLVALYLNAQRHLPELQRQISTAFSSRQLFNLFKAQPGLTEIERAARFLIRSRTSFAGNTKDFAVSKTRGGGAVISRAALNKTLAGFSERLDKVVIEHLPWQRIFRNYDAETTFFFLDPPYLNAPTGAYEGWNEEQLREFAVAVLQLKGKWILTLDASDFNRRLFARCHIKETVSKNRLCNNRTNSDKKLGELIITPK